MTMSVIFCLSYDLLKELFIVLKKDLISTKRVVITLFIIYTVVTYRKNIVDIYDNVYFVFSLVKI